MNCQTRLRKVLSESLLIDTRNFDTPTELLGAIPEMDSMGVMSLIISIEKAFGIIVNSDNICAENFATFGNLQSFIENQI